MSNTNYDYVLEKISKPRFSLKSNSIEVIHSILKFHICEECITNDLLFYNEIKDLLDKVLKIKGIELNEIDALYTCLIDELLVSGCGFEFELLYTKGKFRNTIEKYNKIKEKYEQ